MVSGTRDDTRGGGYEAVDVLVVDDDEDVRASTGEIISSGGYTVAEAADGLEALELLGHLDVGIIVLDIQMPRLGGFALLARLDHPPPTVILSAFGLDEAGDEETKALVHLQKPTTPEELLLTIAGAIGLPGDSA